MRALSHSISKVADSSTSVLVTGETGTGKEVVAKEIHERSPRKSAPLVKVNCGAIPENLIESELFGHEKGAFTGAVSQRKGRFEMARGGTIFLDELGELPPNAQVKLLRVLQEREFERVGGHETIKINVRVVAATNRSLEEEVQQGNFRADLYYRLNVFPIHVPSLKERGADIMLLADHFVSKFSEELGKAVTRIDTPAIDMMMAYHWPGNVRELENTVERAVLLSEDGVIHGHHLPPSLQMKKGEVMGTEKGKFETLVANYERQLIVEALKESWGNQTEAARVLGTTKRVVQYKIQKLNIDYRRYSRSNRTRESGGRPDDFR
jgi:Nif-specific regulatory protein